MKSLEFFASDSDRGADKEGKFWRRVRTLLPVTDLKLNPHGVQSGPLTKPYNPDPASRRMHMVDFYQALAYS